jgi:ABC-type phosphonate transport system ATPase subunit
MKRLETAGEPVVVRGGPDIRSEAAADQRRNNSGTQLGMSQRLQLARRLVEDGEVERA